MNNFDRNPGKFGPWPLGLYTLSDPSGIPVGALHLARNVEIDNLGNLTAADGSSAPNLFSVPPNNFVFGARAFSIDRANGLITYSRPFALIDPTNEEDSVYNTLDVGAEITMFVPVDMGIWVATAAATWFYAGGDALTFQQPKKDNVGALKTTGLRLPDGRAIWTSPVGVMVGDGSGNAKNVTVGAVGQDLFPLTEVYDMLYFDQKGNLKYAVSAL